MSDSNNQQTQEGGRSGFQSASSLPRSTHAPSLSSNRNASGWQPTVPKVGESSTGASASESATAAALPPPAAPNAPAKPVNRPASSKNAIVYSVLQRRNPVLSLIRNVGMEIGDIKADYQVGAHNGVLFLSLKYHRLHPEYIHTRIERISNTYKLRILLVLCDINEHQQPLRELSKLAVINELTILVAFSNEEAAQYLSTLKAYEHKSADSLKERVRQTYPEQLEHVLTSGRKVNKANVETLSTTFGSFANIVSQPNQALNNVKGIGATKTLSLYKAFNEPFVAGGLKVKGGAGDEPTTGKGKKAIKDKRKSKSKSKSPVEDEEATGAGLCEANGDSADESPTETFRRLSTPPTPQRPEDTGLPSRSPSAEPAPPPDAVWHDPLEDDDDGDDDDEPAAKKRRE